MKREQQIAIPHPHVRMDPTILGGSPHIIGTRVPVRRLWAWHQSGVAIDTLTRRYPSLTPAQIYDALAFCYDNRLLVEEDIAIDLEFSKRIGVRS